MATTTTQLTQRTRRELLKTWRGQLVVFISVMILLAILAFLAAISTTNNRIQTFQKLAAVAVPSINATNDAIQYLSGEVSNTADYILAGQGKGSATTDSTTGSVAGNDPASRKLAILKQIETQRTSYDQALQTGFSSLTNPEISVAPDAQSALRYISNRNGRLNDSLALARGLADSEKFTEAIQVYLNGQNEYYQPIITSLYYLRSLHIFLLEDAAKDANSAAALQQNLAAAATVIFAVALLAISLWLSLRVKRLLLPLVNFALVVVAIYSFLLWSIFNASSKDLVQVVDSYNKTALTSDTRLNLTDSFADQVLLVVSNDEIYKQDFQKKSELTLAIQVSAKERSIDPAGLTDCPSDATQRANYKPVGALGDVCRDINKPEEIRAFNQFLTSYRTWLTTNTQFQKLVADSKSDDALKLRAGDGSKAFNQMNKSLSDLRQLSVAEYQSKSKNATDNLNLANQLAWIIYPIALLLTVGGLLRWRQEF